MSQMKKKIYEEQFQKSASQLYFKNIIFYLSKMKKKIPDERFQKVLLNLALYFKNINF